MTTEPDFSKVQELKDKLFSKDKLTKGEIIQILVTVVLIIVILYVYFSTKCSIDCSLCDTATDIIVQRGFK